MKGLAQRYPPVDNTILYSSLRDVELSSSHFNVLLYKKL